jgi:hypothetical protein
MKCNFVFQVHKAMDGAGMRATNGTSRKTLKIHGIDSLF